MTDAIAFAAAALNAARESLQAAMEAACPGPHRFVQHRDGRQAWCKACRRTKSGDEVLP